MQVRCSATSRQALADCVDDVLAEPRDVMKRGRRRKQDFSNVELEPDSKNKKVDDHGLV